MTSAEKPHAFFSRKIGGQMAAGKTCNAGDQDAHKPPDFKYSRRASFQSRSFVEKVFSYKTLDSDEYAGRTARRPGTSFFSASTIRTLSRPHHSFMRRAISRRVAWPR